MSTRSATDKQILNGSCQEFQLNNFFTKDNYVKTFVIASIFLLPSTSLN